MNQSKLGNTETSGKKSQLELKNHINKQIKVKIEKEIPIGKRKQIGKKNDLRKTRKEIITYTGKLEEQTFTNKKKEKTTKFYIVSKNGTVKNEVEQQHVRLIEAKN